MKKIAIIGGSGFKNYKNKNILFVIRHRNGIPPHKINHIANLKAIKKTGIKNIIGICSVGSLQKNILPGTFLVPNDYINLHNIQTIHHKKAVHIIPGLNEELRNSIIKSAKKLKINFLDKGIYYQTQGPRFETKAEIKMISHFADIVGMTMANEATLAQEMGLKYAALCTVDNFANGINNELLEKDWQDGQKNNFSTITKLLDDLFSEISI